MTKSEDPGKYYNKRVSECRIAAQVFFFPIFYFFNPLRARIFTDFGLWSLLEGRVLHKGAWIATLLGTLLGVQDYKKVRFPGRDISSLAVKGLNKSHESQRRKIINAIYYFYRHNPAILIKAKKINSFFNETLHTGKYLDLRFCSVTQLFQTCPKNYSVQASKIKT